MFTIREEAGLVLFLLFRFEVVLSACPKSCDCPDPRNENKIIANCRDRGFKNIMSPQFLVNVTTLDLSANEITSLPNKAFGRQKSLKKLFLSRNKISSIKTGAFSGLTRLARMDLSHNMLIILNGEPFKGLRSLRTLDLSHNNMNYINDTVFNGLKKLRRLILSSNKFIIIPDTTLKPLESLRNVDVSMNLLLCDCHIKWLLKLKKDKVSIKGTCRYPEPLKFNEVARLSPKNLRCDTLQLPFYLFKPKNDEVGVKGDSFTYTCGTTWIPGLRINWYKDNQLLIPNSPDLRGEITFETDWRMGSVITVLTFRKLDLEDTGVYKCVISSDKSSIEGKSSLLILPGGSMYCHAETTKTKKGDFHWDNIAVGSIARMPCPAGTMRASSKSKGFAYRKCSADGIWMDIVADNCGFVDRLTQDLYNLKQAPMNSTTVITVCKTLLRISRNTTRFKSDIDIMYVADILDRIRPYLVSVQQIGRTVVRIVSNLMDVKDTILAEAQMKFKACSSIVLALEELATIVKARTTLVASNVGLSVVNIYPAAYKGKTCAAVRNDKGQLGTISCSLYWQNASTFSPSKQLLEASVHLPKNLFVGTQLLPTTEIRLLFTVFKNSKLFPHIRNGSLVDDPKVPTSVVQLRIGTSLTNLTQPIAIKYYIDQRGFSSPVSVYWKQSQQAGVGAWLENKDCILGKDRNDTITHCTHLTDKSYFAILMSVDKNAGAATKNQRSGFVLEPIVYVGAAICVLLLLITFITYSVFRKLRYNRDDAAMLMNLCLALLVAVVVFVAGINHVSNPLVCRAVGVLLHYFLLCSLLWIGCGGLCLCRLIRTAITPEEFNPVLRYYMISWGIPLIICGITVAGNPDNYSVDKYCWLKPNPFLGAFVGPACLVVLIDIIMFIRLNNLALRTYDSLAYERNAFQTEEEDETAAIAPGENLPDQIAAKCELIQHIEEALPPQDEILVYQKGSLLVLVMILVNFVLGFLLVWFQQSRYLSIALSCAYAVANIALGLIIFIFHCFKNKRAKQHWSDFLKKNVWKKKYTVKHNEEDTHQDNVTSMLVNGDTVRENGTPTPVVPRINGAPHTPVGSDIQSNVSLPSSVALPGDNHINNTKAMVNGGQIPTSYPGSPPGSDKHSITTSMSDKQSCVSAPLPLSHVPPDIRQHPPGYRYTYCVPEIENKKKKSKKKKERIPLVMPENNFIISSRESSIKLKYEENISRKTSKNSLFDQGKKELQQAMTAVSEPAPSELSSREPRSYLDAPSQPYSSCASSGVSVPAACDFQSRPPIPGAPDARDNALPSWPGGRAQPMPGAPDPRDNAVQIWPGGRPQLMPGAPDPRDNALPPWPGGRAPPMPGAPDPRDNALPSWPGGRAPPMPGAPDARDNALPSWPGGRAPLIPSDHFPHSIYGPGNFHYHGIQGPYPKSIPEERYVTIPQRLNGVVRQRPNEHVYESINEPPQNEEQPNTRVLPSSHEQNGPNRSENDLPYTETNSLLPPQRGVHLNGPSNDNLPRKRARRNSDKSRTRRNRDGNPQSKRRQTSSLPPRQSSASSLKPERVKPEPKEWIPEPVPRLNYVPVPFFNTARENRNETSV